MIARLLAYLRAFRVFACYWPSQPTGMAPWGEGDRETFRRFLATPGGLRLLQVMDCTEQIQNRNAVMARDAFSAPYAAGWHSCLAYLKTLSVPTPPQKGPNLDQSEADGDADLLARLSP